MALVITAPESIDGTPHPRIFLAGAIDMGMAEDWQKEVAVAFVDVNATIYNPRRVEFTPDTLDDQIRWELEALNEADLILMWLPGNAKAPVSMFEAGLFWHSGKLVIGADQEFYRRRNLELTGERYGVKLYSSLKDTINAVRNSFDIFK